MTPLVFVTSLVRVLKHVVLPAPLTPSRAIHSPADNPNDAFSTGIVAFCIKSVARSLEFMAGEIVAYMRAVPL